jgi:ATP-dependent Clp protease adaptor protein ClpS
MSKMSRPTINVQVTTSPTPVMNPATDEDQEIDRPWQVIVWNDPVNTMSYVVYVLRKLFGYNETKATELMLQVHFEGRAIVSDGPREKAEVDCFRLHGHGLWATMEH